MKEKNYIPAVESAIRLYMRSSGLREQDLADRLAITQSGVNFTLKNGFGKNVAKKWADTFGFNVQFLLTGKGNLMSETSFIQDSPGCDTSALQGDENMMIPTELIPILKNMSETIKLQQQNIESLTRIIDRLTSSGPVTYITNNEVQTMNNLQENCKQNKG